jgi:alpha-galactosidase
MLYYAPQSWTSDDTDAVERLKIQYGTSIVYPLSCMGAHVSDVPNQQVLRTTPLETRANVAYFGVFGYELDLNKLSEKEKSIIKEQVDFAKQYRSLIQRGLFYRLKSPFEGDDCAWMVVSEDRSEALVGYYKFLNRSNTSDIQLRLCGLSDAVSYKIMSRPGGSYFGDELMNAGIVVQKSELCAGGGDFSSVLYYLY